MRGWQRALSKSGFSDIGIDIKNSDLWIEAQNDKYYYSARAVVMIFRSIEKIIPPDTREVRVILKQNGIPMFELITTGADITDLYADELTIGEFIYLSKINTEITDTRNVNAKNRGLLSYGFKPSFQTFLNDPSGFLKFRLGLMGWIGYHPWKGHHLLPDLTAILLIM